MFFFFLGRREVFESPQLEQFAHALDIIQRRCPSMSIGQLSTLLHIGMIPRLEGQHISVSDVVAKSPNQKYSTIARRIDLLGDGTSNVPGMGLIEKQPNPEDRRNRYVAISERGKFLLEELDLILAPDIIRTIEQKGAEAPNA